jgi:hypothetical protein
MMRMQHIDKLFSSLPAGPELSIELGKEIDLRISRTGRS